MIGCQRWNGDREESGRKDVAGQKVASGKWQVDNERWTINHDCVRARVEEAHPVRFVNGSTATQQGFQGLEVEMTSGISTWEFGLWERWT